MWGRLIALSPQPPPFGPRGQIPCTSSAGASFLGCPMDPSMSSTFTRSRKLRSRRGEKQLFVKNPSKHYVINVFLYLDLPGIAAETELMRDCFGDRSGDRLGVVWRPESNANQPKHTTSNKMQPTSIAIQTIATQSNAFQ